MLILLSVVAEYFAYVIAHVHRTPHTLAHTASLAVRMVLLSEPPT